ncbi:MAG: thioredoxin family protein [Thiobacillus sp.]
MTARLPLALVSLLATFALDAAPTKPAKPHGTYYGAQATHYPDWFKESFLDLRADIHEARQTGKRVILMFTQDNCPYCAALVERNLSQRQTETTLREKFDVIAVNLWGDREIVGLDGKTYTEKTYGAALKVQFTPTLLFFDESGETVLRLNGYVPPARFQAALDWVGSRQEKLIPFRDFVAARETSTTGGGLESHAYVNPAVRDLRRTGRSPKPLAVFFEQKDCPDCSVLHRRVMADPEVRRAIGKLDAVQLDMWSRDPVVTPDGKRLPVREWARLLGVNYAPGIVLFDPAGQEVIRWESAFRVFHTQGMFDYVSSGAYRKEPSFQRYLAGKTERIREAGRDVNIWRYADEPVATR